MISRPSSSLGVMICSLASWSIRSLASTSCAVDLAGDGHLGQAGADGLGNVGHRNRAGKLAARVVGERDLDHEKKTSARKTKKRGLGPRFGCGLSAGCRPAHARTTGLSPSRKRPLIACGVVRGVITRVPFSLLLLLRRSCRFLIRSRCRTRGRRRSSSPCAPQYGRLKAGRKQDPRGLLSAGTKHQALREDQWNCSSSVEPLSAVTLDLPPWITVVTSSK